MTDYLDGFNLFLQRIIYTALLEWNNLDFLLTVIIKVMMTPFPEARIGGILKYKITDSTLTSIITTIHNMHPKKI